MAIALTTIQDAEAEEIYLTLTAPGKKELRREVKEGTEKLALAGNTLLDDMQRFVIERSGLSKKIIQELAEDELQTLGSFFQAYDQTLNKDFNVLVNDGQSTIADDTIKQDVRLPSPRLQMWQAVLVNTCPDCLELHGTTKPRSVWIREGVPNQRPTLCVKNKNARCHCQLIDVDTAPSRTDIRAPILIQQKRIRRAEKKRGKRYSASYKKQIAGSINNPDKRLDLRKAKFTKVKK